MAKPKNEEKIEQENTERSGAKQEETAPANTGENTGSGELEGAEKTDTSGKRAIEVWASELRVPSWQLAALKQYKKYASGKTVSRAEFEAGLSAALNKPMRG